MLCTLAKTQTIYSKDNKKQCQAQKKSRRAPPKNACLSEDDNELCCSMRRHGFDWRRLALDPNNRQTAMSHDLEVGTLSKVDKSSQTVFQSHS